MEKVDGIIVGQGLAGTLLAHELHLRHSEIKVIDDGREMTSSKIAAGIYNPITGRRMVKTWLCDELFPTLPDYYVKLETLTGDSFHHPLSIYRPFTSMEEQNDWQSKAGEAAFEPYIAEFYQGSLGLEGVIDPFGGLRLNYSGYLELPLMLAAMRELFSIRGMLLSELFHYDQLVISEEGIQYRDLCADWIIFCEGPAVTNNPYFRSLRFRLVRGELLGIETSVEMKHIVNRGVFMIPKDGFIQVGSTYDHKRVDWSNTPEGIEELEQRLKKLYTKDYKIVHKKAGVRPATFDRRPFMGMLKKTPRIGIFNGLGAKGVSLGPHFAQLMTKHLLDGAPLPAEVSIDR